METLFKKYNIKNYKRIEGFSGEKRKNEFIPPKNKYFPDQNRKIINSELGCTISHLLSLKYFVEHIKSDVCLIFEDDINFEYDKYFFTYFSEYLKDIPSDFDIIQLSVILPKKNFNDFKNPSIYRKRKENYFSCGAYLIKKNAAEKILSKVHINNGKFDFSYYNYFYIADHFIFNNLEKVYTIPLIGLNTDDTTIITENVKNKMKFHIESANFLRESWNNLFKNIKKNIENFPHIYYINRDQDKKRKNFMEYQLNKLGLNFNRFDAITPKNFNLKKPKKKIILDNREEFEDTEYCATISHLKCINIAYRKNLKNVVILEDDCSFIFLKYLYNFDNILKKEFDIFRLSIQGKYVQKLTNIYFIKEEDDSWRGASSYLLTRKGMENILKKYNYNDNFIFQENLNIIADIGIFLYAGKCINFPFLSTKNFGSTIQPLKNWHFNVEREHLYIQKLWRKFMHLSSAPLE